MARTSARASRTAPCTVAKSAVAPVLTRTLECVQPQQGQRQRLAGPIVQVGTDAAQRLLIQGGGPSARLEHPLVQARVLRQQALQLVDPSLELAPLLPDGVAATLDDPGQEQVGQQAEAADHGPRAQLGGVQLGLEGIRQQVELVDGDHLAAAVLAHRRVDLDQPAIPLPIMDVLGLVQVAHLGRDRAIDGAGQAALDREALAHQLAITAVQQPAVQRPDLEHDHALAEPVSATRVSSAAVSAAVSQRSSWASAWRCGPSTLSTYSAVIPPVRSRTLDSI